MGIILLDGDAGVGLESGSFPVTKANVATFKDEYPRVMKETIDKM